MKKEQKIIFESIQEALTNVDAQTKESNRKMLIELLHEFLNKISLTDARGLNILEFAKVFDLTKEINDVINYLETEQDETFESNGDC